MDDSSLALGLLRALVSGQEPARVFFHARAGAPVAKERPRFARKGRQVYTSGKTSSAEDLLALELRVLIGGRPLTGNVAIVAVFFRPNRQRIDADNMMKLVMDAATKAGVWDDDCQVTRQAAVVEMDRRNPRTLVAFCPTTSTLDRSVKA